MAAKDALVVAATRPAMRWGVTLDGIIVNGMVTLIAFIATNSLFALLLFVPIHGLMYLVCLKDPRRFRFAYLATVTKGKSLGWRHWGAATAAPMPNIKRKRGGV